MCLGIPMQIIECDGFSARCRRGEEERTVNLLLVGAQPVGTWVLVLMDHAREVLTEEHARQIDDAVCSLEAVLRGEVDLDAYFADLELPSVVGPPR